MHSMIANHDAYELALLRREAATVRMLLEELEQLTGETADQVGQQLAEELVLLARRLVDASMTIAGVRRTTSGLHERPAAAFQTQSGVPSRENKAPAESGTIETATPAHRR